MAEVKVEVISRFLDRQANRYVDPQPKYVLDDREAKRLEAAKCVVILGAAEKPKRKPKRKKKVPKEEKAQRAKEDK